MSIPCLARVLLALLLMTAPAASADFPVTVHHSLGETTIAERPVRIVSIGLNDQDFLYALDIAPVGVRVWWGDQPYATWPWSEKQRARLNARPAIMRGTSVDPEWVLALHPDLIVATYADIGERLYRQLGEIAPVVVAPAGYAPWSAPWQEQLRLLDRATSGSEEKAQNIIAGFNRKVSAIRTAHPEFKGKTAAFIDIRDGQFTLWRSSTATGRFLGDLGFTLPATLEKEADAAGWIRLGFEHAQRLDLDVAIWPQGKQETAESIRPYRDLRLYREKRSIWLGPDSLLSAALWFQSPQSIDFALDEVVPLISSALQEKSGDQTTR